MELKACKRQNGEQDMAKETERDNKRDRARQKERESMHKRENVAVGQLTVNL